MSECAREGCGHKRKRHQWVMDRRDISSEKGCDCSGFLPPRPVPEEALTAYEWWLDLRAQQDRKLREGIQAVGGDPE